jgi:hypothetical protein
MGGGSQELGLLIEDEIDGGAQVRCVSKPVCILILILGAAVHQNPARAECFRRQDIAYPVSDPPAARQIDIELLGGLPIQQHAWLATVTWASELGQVRTEVVRIEVRTLGL